ncbi:MAG: hypothetical protein SGJ20_10275 [Planctomycetota bacterium]|nr:hypothetical protein [Planctomycetota bacterium]
MNEREYLRLRQEAKKEYHRKLEALEMVWEMANKSSPPSDAKPRIERRKIAGAAVARIDSPLRANRQVVNQAILDAVTAMPVEFNSRQVVEAIGQSGEYLDRSTVSHALMRLCKLGKIALIREGSGKRPTEFSKIAEVTPAFISNVEAEFATQEQQAKIRETIQSKGMSVQVVRRYITERWGAEKLSQLSVDQTVELLGLVTAGAFPHATESQLSKSAGE